MHTGGAAPYRGRSSHLGGLAFLRALHSPAHPPARLDTARVVAMSGQTIVCGVVSCVWRVVASGGAGGSRADLGL